jgi:hypothetical protein
VEPKTITTLEDHQSIYMSHAQIILAEEDDDEGVAYAEPFTLPRAQANALSAGVGRFSFFGGWLPKMSLH